MKHLLTTLLLGFLIFSSSLALANNQNKGFYIQGDMGTNIAHIDMANIFNKNVVSKTTVGPSISTAVGYQLRRHFAIEAGYAVLFKRRFKYAINSAHAAAVVIFPLGQKVKLDAKLGINTLFDRNGAAPGPFVGVGAAYALNKKVDLNAQIQTSVYPFYAIVVMGTSTFTQATAGLTYHFG